LISFDVFGTLISVLESSYHAFEQIPPPTDARAATSESGALERSTNRAVLGAVPSYRADLRASLAKDLSRNSEFSGQPPAQSLLLTMRSALFFLYDEL